MIVLGSGRSLLGCRPGVRALKAKPGSCSPILRNYASQMAEGTIKRVTDKGFGFIETSPGKDMFFHMSACEGVRFEDLQPGQRVSFTEGQGPKGPRAEHVKRI